MSQHILNIGVIPEDCSEELIMAGDPDSFGGKEITISYDEDGPVRCSENGVEVKAGKFFDRKDKMWKKIIDDITEPLLQLGSRLTASDLADAWAFFMDEPENIKASIEQVSDEDGFGEFNNTKGMYNGKVYVRYQFEEDEEYFGERIIVLSS